VSRLLWIPLSSLLFSVNAWDVLQERYKVHYSKASETAGQHQKSEAKVAVFLRSMQEKMKSEELPTAALGLGLAGAIPFILLTPPFSSLLPVSVQCSCAYTN
jgi:hypothetical protein